MSEHDQIQLGIDIAVTLIWLVCVIVCFLKRKIWTAIFGIVAPTLSEIPIGGMYLHHIITEPFMYIGLPAAAIRLARPDSWWSNRYYSQNTSKFVRAVIRHGLVKEYIEDRRKALAPEEFKICLANLRVMALRSRAANKYVSAAINEAMQPQPGWDGSKRAT